VRCQTTCHALPDALPHWRGMAKVARSVRSKCLSHQETWCGNALFASLGGRCAATGLTFSGKCSSCIQRFTFWRGPSAAASAAGAPAPRSSRPSVNPAATNICCRPAAPPDAGVPTCAPDDEPQLRSTVISKQTIQTSHMIHMIHMIPRPVRISAGQPYALQHPARLWSKRSTLTSNLHVAGSKRTWAYRQVRGAVFVVAVAQQAAGEVQAAGEGAAAAAAAAREAQAAPAGARIRRRALCTQGAGKAVSGCLDQGFAACVCLLSPSIFALFSRTSRMLTFAWPMLWRNPASASPGG